MDIIQREISEQPQAVLDFIRYYFDEGGLALLDQIPDEAVRVLTGMGASYHAALIGGYEFLAGGMDVKVIEAIDLLSYYGSEMKKKSGLVYLSQSGKSGEIEPMVQMLPAGATLVGVTNHPECLLGERARVTLPLLGGDETLIASKTYVNSLLALWLLARRKTGRWDGGERDQLALFAERAAGLLARQDEIAGQWVETLSGCQPLVFMGHGPCGATARQAAMTLGEWAKAPAIYWGLGAFRHGPIEVMEAGAGAVLFVEPETRVESTLELAKSLEGIGVKTLVVRAGETYRPNQALPPATGLAPYLARALDIFPVQCCALALARLRPVAPGFRYIQKVTSDL